MMRTWRFQRLSGDPSKEVDAQGVGGKGMGEGQASLVALLHAELTNGVMPGWGDQGRDPCCFHDKAGSRGLDGVDDEVHDGSGLLLVLLSLLLGGLSGIHVLLAGLLWPVRADESNWRFMRWSSPIRTAVCDGFVLQRASVCVREHGRERLRDVSVKTRGRLACV